MSRIPEELHRTLTLPCGMIGDDGQLVTELDLRPLTMLESCRMEAKASALPEELDGVVDLQVWAMLVRTATMIQRFGTLEGDQVTPELLLELPEVDCMFLVQQAKEVSLEADRFRGGQAPGDGRGVPGGDSDGVERSGAAGDA